MRPHRHLCSKLAICMHGVFTVLHPVSWKFRFRASARTIGCVIIFSASNYHFLWFCVSPGVKSCRSRRGTDISAHAFYSGQFSLFTNLKHWIRQLNMAIAANMFWHRNVFFLHCGMSVDALYPLGGAVALETYNIVFDHLFGHLNRCN